MRIFEVSEKTQLIDSDVFRKALNLLKEHNIGSRAFNFAISPLVDELIFDCHQFYNTLITQSSKFLNEMKNSGTLPFRGSESASVENGIGIFQSASIENRRPMSSVSTLQTQLSAAMSSAGIKATRSNSIFTTGRYEHANSYGIVSVIFPKNTANFSWSDSEDYKDIILNLRDEGVTNTFKDSEIYKKALSLVKTYPEKYDLNRLLSKKCGEASISYYDFKFKHKDIASMSGFYKHQFEEFIHLDTIRLLKEMNIKTSNFSAALDAAGEILINGEYISIRTDSYIILNYIFPDLPRLPSPPFDQY